jgi:protein-disulfide isomerase
MKNLALLVAVSALASCSQDNKTLEKDVQDMKKELHEMHAMLQAGGGARPGAAGQQRAQRPGPDGTKTYAMPIEGDPVDGPPTAKVTLVKAYDYACPFCEKVRDSMEELRKKYGDDLRIVYKQFVVHPQVATAGALAVCAANKQGKFMEMDKLLWDKGYKSKQFDREMPAEAGGQPQKCWESAAGCPVVLGFASELGLNTDKFKADMKGECQALIQKDMKDLQSLGVGATPAFFINGRFLSGAMPTENFVTVIDEEMKKANEKIQAGTPANELYKQWVLDKGLKTVQ